MRGRKGERRERGEREDEGREEGREEGRVEKRGGMIRGGRERSVGEGRERGGREPTSTFTRTIP